MLIKNLKISNILSIADATIAFSDKGLVLLDGYNYDDSTANGAGKSAIFNALSFALYGKMPRDVTATEYLRKGTKSGFAEVTVQTIDGEWTVKRSRPTNITFVLNGAEAKITQEEFEKKIGLNYQQFLLTVYASQLKTDKFIFLNDSDKKDFLLQLMNMEKISKAKDLAFIQAKDLNIALTKTKQDLSVLIAKIATVKEFLIDREELEIKLSKLDTAPWLKEISQLELISKPDLSKYKELEDKIQIKRQVFSEIQANITVLRRGHAELLKTLKKVADVVPLECPHCNSKVIVTSGGDLWAYDDVKTRNDAVEEHNIRIQEKAATITQQIGALEEELLKRHELDALQTKLKEKQYTEMAYYAQAQSRILELRSVVSRIEMETTNIRRRLDEDSTNKAKIATLEDQKQKLEASIIVQQDKLLLAESVLSVLSPMGVQAYIADLVLDRLNEKTSYYLSLLWPNASYRILSYKENKSGEIKAKFSEKLIIGGRERSLGSLSGGELRCISLVLDLAVISVVTQMLGIQINPLILDEPFDGMDSANKERAIEMLSEVAKFNEIWVIDHSSEAKSAFTRTVRVEKRNEVTSVV